MRCNLVCKECGESFIANSGYRKWCDACLVDKKICPECGNEKSIYDRFCGNSCAGKYKYRNSEKVRQALLDGKQHPNRGIGISKYRKDRKRLDLAGDKNPHWNPNLTYEDRRIKRHTSEEHQWRIEIKKRDNFTCQICHTRGGRLNSHHIAPVKDYPELICDLDNGMCLCVECHKRVHRWMSNLKLSTKHRKRAAAKRK